jgi:hypothetical protein
LAGGSESETLEAGIRARRRLSLDGLRAIYDLTSGVDFSKPRHTAEAIAQVVWEEDVKAWWNWKGGEIVFTPNRKVEIRLPRDHHRKISRASEEFWEDLEKGEFAAHVGSYVSRVRDDRADWTSIFLWGPLWAWLMQNWQNQAREREELDRLFDEMTGYIIVSPT